MEEKDSWSRPQKFRESMYQVSSEINLCRLGVRSVCDKKQLSEMAEILYHQTMGWEDAHGLRTGHRICYDANINFFVILYVSIFMHMQTQLSSSLHHYDDANLSFFVVSYGDVCITWTCRYLSILICCVFTCIPTGFHMESLLVNLHLVGCPWMTNLPAYILICDSPHSLTIDRTKYICFLKIFPKNKTNCL